MSSSHRPRFYSKAQEGFLTKLQKTNSFRRQRHNSILDEFFFLGTNFEPLIPPPSKEEIPLIERTPSAPFQRGSECEQSTAKMNQSSKKEVFTKRYKDEVEEQEEFDADPYESIEFDYEPTDILNTILHSFTSKKDEAKSDLSTAKSLIQRKIKEIRSHDKILFFLGILMLIFVSFLISYDPCGLFIYFNAALCLGMIFIRYFRFKARGMQYYLIEFCYCANYLIWAYAIFFVKNSTLFNIAFFFAEGNLSWAIPTYRNSLIFHNVDHLTTLLIHSQPMLAMSVLRWNEGNGESCPQNLHSPMNSLGEIFAVYIGWMTIYYLIIFVFAFNYIKRNKYQTLYWYTQQQKDKFAGKWVNMCGKKKVKSFMYMSLHFTSSIIAGFLSVLQFHNKYWNIIYVGGLLLLAIWNGADYYFEYFAKKYEASLETIKILSERGVSLEDAINSRGGFGDYEEEHGKEKKMKEE